MNGDLERHTQTMFDSIKHLDVNGFEYWDALEFGKALGYTWQGFERVIERSKLSITSTGQAVNDHFVHVSKMVAIGSKAERIVEDIHLTRYACYIIAQNGNAAKKPNIAAAQAYFAIKTRKQEIVEQRNNDIERLVARQKFTESDRHMSEVVIEKGMAAAGLAAIKSSGDTHLFGGRTTRQMKEIYGIEKSKTPLANRMPNVVLAAKSLANEMTATNLESNPIDTYDDIKSENDGNNDVVRDALGQRGIIPEKLSPAEDTTIIANRIRQQDKTRSVSSNNQP